MGLGGLESNRKTVRPPVKAFYEKRRSRAIRNPGAFYFTDYTTHNGDWTWPQNGDFWQDGVKTLFDPCPAGWRVPRSGEEDRNPWNALTIDNGPWDASVYGRLFNSSVIYGGTAWFPASGARYPESGFKGHLYIVTRFGFHWSSSTLENAQSRYISFSPGSVNPHDGYIRTRGFSVRCVRE